MLEDQDVLTFRLFLYIYHCNNGRYYEGEEYSVGIQLSLIHI